MAEAPKRWRKCARCGWRMPAGAFVADLVQGEVRRSHMCRRCMGVLKPPRQPGGPSTVHTVRRPSELKPPPERIRAHQRRVERALRRRKGEDFGGMSNEAAEAFLFGGK